MKLQLLSRMSRKDPATVSELTIMDGSSKTFLYAVLIGSLEKIE